VDSLAVWESAMEDCSMEIKALAITVGIMLVSIIAGIILAKNTLK